MKRHSPTRRLTLITMLLAMSILMHMIEPSLPIPIPGVKLGLANILGLITMFLFGIKSMIMLEVEGAGDYLPSYSGNLDIMTAAAKATGELMAERRMAAKA